MPLQAKKLNISPSPRWKLGQLLVVAKNSLAKLRKQRGAASENSPWWPFIHTAEQLLPEKIRQFIAGEYKFEPMLTYRMPDETMVVWQYQDRVIIRLLLQTIKPLFKYIISWSCFHLAGPSGVKKAISYVEKGLSANTYSYFLRVDIKSYYASIDRSILSAQIKNTFADLRLVKYLEDVVNIPIIDNAVITLPKTGIARRNSLSPFFGGLYLSAVDQYFAQAEGIFYARFMDDILILAKTKRQFCRAKRNLRKMLRALKLQYSRRKTKMGLLTKGFHFLGIDFKFSAPAMAEQKQAATQIQPVKTNVSVNLHQRSAQRALENVIQMREDCELNAHQAQKYIFRWARWWSQTSDYIGYIECLLLWVKNTSPA